MNTVKLTKAQYSLLLDLKDGPVTVHGSRKRMAVSMAERGLVETWGAGWKCRKTEAAITDIGRKAIEGDG